MKYFPVCLSECVFETYWCPIPPPTAPAEQECPRVPQRVQCLQHLPEPRARVRLPEEPGDRGEDQQDPLAAPEERLAVPVVDQRSVACFFCASL